MSSRIEPNESWDANCREMVFLYDNSIRYHRRNETEAINPIIAKGNIFEGIEAVF